LPARVGRFVVRGLLGRGAFGAVYRAYDPQLDREVALKVPQPGTLGNARAVARFLREAKSAARLRHPHIVPVYDAGRDGEHHYIASAFIDGHTLQHTIDEGTLDVRQSARIVGALAEALAYAHRLGIVHRDVKPTNVMLDAAAQPHLMDFGLATRHDATVKLTRDGAVLGTPAYMAPEQAAGQQGEALPASDQYSLGVILYELLCGEVPFSGPAPVVLYNAIHQEPRPPRAVKPELPSELETICLKAMAKRPQDRYPDCQALADDLRHWLAGEPIEAPAGPPLRRPGRRLLAAAAGVCFAALIGGGIFLAPRLRPPPTATHTREPDRLRPPPAAPTTASPQAVVPPSDLKEPYRLRIVLHVARNQLLKEDFRRQLQRELKDRLQRVLGKLAEVEVASKDPRLADVLAHGLGKLDGWRERSAHKTHFVLINFSGTNYEIQARQHDGLTGLPSPTVRREQTPKRADVARHAALLVERDLGLLGTVESRPDGTGRVRVQLKGGGLGVDLRRWVKKDDVLGLVRVRGDSPGQAMPWAFLRVETPPTAGVCNCKLFSRYRLGQVKGLRCVLLATRSGSLRLHVVQQAPGGEFTELQAPVRLHLRRHGFEGEHGSLLSVWTSRTGDVDTTSAGEKGKFDRMAFISVRSGSRLEARIPVALVDERVIVLPVPASDEDTTQALERYHLLRRSVTLSYTEQAERFKEINELLVKPADRAKALALAREMLQRSRQDRAQLTRERNEVEKELNGVKLSPKERPSFQAIDKWLRLLRISEADLMKHIALLEKIERQESDPKKKGLEQVARAQLLEKEAEVGQAIALYKKVLADGFKSAALVKHLARLEKQWQIKDAAHEEARRFIYQVWPGLNTRGLKERLEDARSAFAVCQKAGDVISPRKLLRATEVHLERLIRELKDLKPEVNGDERKPAQLIVELTPELRKLTADVCAYLERAG
jgi:hypothetical protein